MAKNHNSYNKPLNDRYRQFSELGDLESLKALIQNFSKEHLKRAYLTAILQNMRGNNNNNLFLNYFFGNKLLSFEEESDAIDGGSFLNAACKQGNLNYVMYFVRHGMDVNKKNKRLKIPLHFAVACGNIECSKFLLENGSDIEAYDIKHKNPLLKASTRGDIEMIKLLIEFGCKLDAKDKNHFGAIHYAAFKGQLETMKFLFEKGLSAQSKDKNGISLILQICGRKKEVHDNIEVIKLILEKGGLLDDSSHSHQTPLLAATRAGNFKIVKYLIEKGCKLNVKNRQKKTALHYAAQNNHVEMMKYLVDKGISLSSRDQTENTPLLTAAQNGSLDVVKYLLSKGCSVTEKSMHQTTVFLKSIHSENLNLISFLLDNGSSIEEKDEFLNNALFTATIKGNIEIANFLIEKGINIDHKNIWEENCLFYGQTIEILKLLVSKGVKLEKNKSNFGPLLRIIPGSNLEVIKYLIEVVGDSVLNVDEQGRGPLYKAIPKGNLEILQYLIDSGCSVSQLDSSFNTPILYACSHANIETIEFLLKHSDNGMKDLDMLGFTPLLKTVNNNQRISVIEFLIKNGSSFSEKTTRGSNILMLSAMKKNTELVEYLLKNGVSMLEKNTKNLDALSYSKGELIPIFQKFQKSIEYEIQTSKYKLTKDSIKNYETLLKKCIIHGNLLLLIETISKVDNVNFIDKEGNSILNLSIIFDKIDIFDFLIENVKFDLKMKNDENLIPIDISMKKGNIYVMSKLLKIYGNIYEIDSSFFENSRIHKDTWDFTFKWKIYSFSNEDLNFKYK
eukprot:gene3358-5905_t